MPVHSIAQYGRQRISINDNWRFIKNNPAAEKELLYDVRPEVSDANDNVVADSKPSEAVAVASSSGVLKDWILPSANDFRPVIFFTASAV